MSDDRVFRDITKQKNVVDLLISEKISSVQSFHNFCCKFLPGKFTLARVNYQLEVSDFL